MASSCEALTLFDERAVFDDLDLELCVCVVVCECDERRCRLFDEVADSALASVGRELFEARAALALSCESDRDGDCEPDEEREGERELDEAEEADMELRALSRLLLRLAPRLLPLSSLERLADALECDA